MDVIDSLMHGAIDMHMHTSPDPHAPRSVDAFQAAEQAAQAGMKAIVLKSHDYPTAPVAIMASARVPNVNVFGSLSLDAAVGGINATAVESSALMGAKVLWMPTFSAANDMARRGMAEQGIRIIDEHGLMLPALTQALKIAKQHEMVVATGHVSLAEIRAFVREAGRVGINKIVITHAMEPRVGTTLTIDQQLEMAEQGAYIEHCFGTTLASGGGISMRTVARAIVAVGPDRCILTTDLGQKHNPPPAEGMRAFISEILECGLEPRHIEKMVKTNPARLLGLL
jgi:hypothetical protein